MSGIWFPKLHKFGLCLTFFAIFVFLPGGGNHPWIAAGAKALTAMSSFIIEGGHKLSGAIHPQGAKNEALEVISAVLLTEEEVVISNIPEILDVRNLILVLEGMGVKVRRLEKGKFSFKADSVDRNYILSEEFVRKCSYLRGSVMVVGPLLARFGMAYFPKPGGDKIGRRRVDTHIQGMLNLGAAIEYDDSLRAFRLSVPEGGHLKGRYMLLRRNVPM